MNPRIILTRPIQDSVSLKQALISSHFDVQVIPMIEISPAKIQIDSLHTVLENSTSLIFTSSNAVSAFQTQIERYPSLRLITKKKEIYTIGEKTFAEASKLGGEMKALPKTFTSNGMIDFLKGENIREKNFLFLTGNISKTDISDWIQRNGGKCLTVEVYKNSAIKLSKSDIEVLLQAMALRDSAMIFYSPSAVDSLFHQIPRINPLCAFFSIGETTKKAILKWNDICAGLNEEWTVISPSISNENELIKLVQEFFNRKGYSAS